MEITICECCEVWVYSDQHGECEAVGFTQNEKEAFDKAEEFMKNNPKGFYEIMYPQPKEVFIFR